MEITSHKMNLGLKNNEKFQKNKSLTDNTQDLD